MKFVKTLVLAAILAVNSNATRLNFADDDSIQNLAENGRLYDQESSILAANNERLLDSEAKFVHKLI